MRFYLMVTCEICNRRFKGNLFPLEDPTKRARDHRDDMHKERPLFVDPCTEDPGLHIGWRGADLVALSERGSATIKALDLACLSGDPHRRELVRFRRERMEILKHIADVLELDSAPPAMVDWAHRMAAQFLSSDAEYLAMTRAFLGLDGQPDGAEQHSA